MGSKHHYQQDEKSTLLRFSRLNVETTLSHLLWESRLLIGGKNYINQVDNITIANIICCNHFFYRCHNISEKIPSCSRFNKNLTTKFKFYLDPSWYRGQSSDPKSTSGRPSHRWPVHGRSWRRLRSRAKNGQIQRPKTGFEIMYTKGSLTGPNRRIVQT